MALLTPSTAEGAQNSFEPFPIPCIEPTEVELVCLDVAREIAASLIRISRFDPDRGFVVINTSFTPVLSGYVALAVELCSELSGDQDVDQMINHGIVRLTGGGRDFWMMPFTVGEQALYGVRIDLDGNIEFDWVYRNTVRITGVV